MKIQITPRKPRNPLVAAARMRPAGAHGTGARALRQQARRALQREIGDLRSADHRRPCP